MWHLLLLGGMPIGRIMPGLSPLVLRYFGKVRLCHAGEVVPFNQSIIRPVTRLGEVGAVCLRAPPYPFWFPLSVSKACMRSNVSKNLDIVHSSGGNC